MILVNVWYGAPFFLIMYLAALKSVPEQLYEAASIDGANAWQKFVHITLPMMRNIIAITVLFSLIVTFANFDIVQIMTAGGPRNMTHVFATYSFLLGIRSGDLPLGAATVAVHVPDPGDCGGLHPARRAQAREGDRMSTMPRSPRRPRAALRVSSLQRNRRWALITSYVFLILFAIFFLLPPYYMIVTSLKSDAEVAHMATNPWIIANGITLDQFRILFNDTDFLIFFKNTAIVTVCVVVDHHGDQRARRFLARPHAVLGIGHPRDRHLPDLPGARHAAVHSAVPDRQMDRPAQFLLGHGAGLPDADRAVLHLDHDRLFPVDPERARRSGAHRRRRPYADAAEDLHSRGAARHHRGDDLRLHRVMGGLRLSDGLSLFLRPAGADGRHRHQPDPRRTSTNGEC